MTGYIRPCKGQMKGADWDCFQGVYCGLCRAIGRRYGRVSRGFLSYDFVFLALLIMAERPITAPRRCLVNPFKKRPCAEPNAALADAADATVLFVRQKLLDTVRDESFRKRVGARILYRLTAKAGRKAEAALPRTAARLRENLQKLLAMEKENLPSLDRPADTFAGSLEALSEISPAERKEAVARVLYHAGRWVYLLDAADDISEDFGRRYNPILAKYRLSEPIWDDVAQADMLRTLAHSRNAAVQAFETL